MKWILGIDAAYTDVFIKPPENIARDLIAMDGDHHRFNTLPIEEIRELALRYPGGSRFGGTIMNTLAQVAALGGKAAFLGILGDDEAGRAVSQNMMLRNIREVVPPQGGKRSPVMYTLRDGIHETLYYPDTGNALDMTADMLPADIPADQLIVAMQMERTLQIDPALIKRLHHWRQNGAQLALGIQHLHAAKVRKNPAYHSTCYNADYVFGNLKEYSALTDDPHPLFTIQQASVDTPYLYVITNGEHNVFTVREDHTTSHTPLSIPADNIVCSIGAGDAIMGGTLFGQAQTDPVWADRQSVQLGLLCAHNILQIDGGQPPSIPGHLADFVKLAGPKL